MKYYIIPVFVPHLGCPHDCVFCDQAKITNQERSVIKEVTGQDVHRIVDEYLSTMDTENAVIEISFFGGTFTAIPRLKQEELLSAAKYHLDKGQINHIRCSTRPDYINDEILDFVKSCGMDIIELGVQSLNEDVLFLSGRGHNSKSVEEASLLIKKHGIKLGHQLMLGLPGDNKEKDLESAKRSIKMAPDFVRIYPALIIKGTPMEAMFLKGIYKPYSLDKAIAVSSEMIDMFSLAGVNVIRVGLQPTEEISPGNSLVAGPYHPAFRELTQSYSFWKKIREFVLDSADFEHDENEHIFKKDSLVIKVNPKDISTVFADKKKYLIEFMDLMSDKEINVLTEQAAHVNRGIAMVSFRGVEFSITI
ncbi:MAG: radical SAM protein [Clostridiaceae bacterium]